MKGWYYIKKKHMKEGKVNETKQEKKDCVHCNSD